MDLTTLLITVFCLVDEGLAGQRLGQRGPRPTLADRQGDETPFRLLTSRDSATVGGKFTSRWTCSVSPLNSTSSQPKSSQTARMIASVRSRWMAVNTGCRYFVTKTKWRATQLRSADLYERRCLVA